MQMCGEAREGTAQHRERLRTGLVVLAGPGEMGLQHVAAHLEEHAQAQGHEGGTGPLVRLAQQGDREAEDQEDVAEEIAGGEGGPAGAEGVGGQGSDREVQDHRPPDEDSQGVQPELRPLPARSRHARKGKEPPQDQRVAGQVAKARQRLDGMPVPGPAVVGPEHVSRDVEGAGRGQATPGAPRSFVLARIRGRAQAKDDDDGPLRQGQEVAGQVCGGVGSDCGPRDEGQGVDTQGERQ